MAVKYRLAFNNLDLSDIIVDISHEEYTGNIISIIGVGGESVVLSRDMGPTPHGNHVVPTTASINLYTDLVDVDELQKANDKEWSVTILKNSELWFSGFLVPDGIQKTLKGAGNFVSINATCGLALLKGVLFNYEGAGWGTVTIDGQVSELLCPMMFIRQLLGHNKYVNSSIPIIWSTSIRYDVDPTRDFFAGSMPFSSSYSLTALFEFFDIDAHWLLDNLMKSAKCWIFQDRGKWNIINLYDVIRLNGIIPTLEISSVIGSVTAISRTIDVNKNLSGSQINDDSYITYTRPIGGVNVVYNHLQSSNILPNGSFDSYNEFFGTPQYWRYISGTYSYVNKFASLNGREGLSADLDRRSLDEAVFSIDTPINIDANLLYNEINFGFRIMPLSGFEEKSVDGLTSIDWSKRPLRISLEYTGNGTTYYLNEFGYWGDKAMKANGRIKSWNYYDNNDPVANRRNTINVVFDHLTPFYPGDRFVVGIKRWGIVEYHIVQFDVLMTAKDGAIFIASKIHDCFSNTNLEDPYITLANVQEPDPLNTPKMTKDPLYFQNIFPEVEGSNNEDIIDFQFTSKAGSSMIKIPQMGDMDSINGKFRLKFWVKAGQRYVLDDVYININENQDLYKIDMQNNNSREDLELGISTAFTGFNLSSYKEHMGNAEKYMLMSDYSGTSKTLTELYGRSYLTWRSKAKKIYSGSFKNDFGFLSLVEIEGIKYIPLSQTSNLSNGRITTFTAIEAELEEINPTVIHKGTNNNNK